MHLLTASEPALGGFRRIRNLSLTCLLKTLTHLLTAHDPHTAEPASCRSMLLLVNGIERAPVTGNVEGLAVTARCHQMLTLPFNIIILTQTQRVRRLAARHHLPMYSVSK